MRTSTSYRLTRNSSSAGVQYSGAVVRLWIPVVDELALCCGPAIMEKLAAAFQKRISAFLARESLECIQGITHAQNRDSLGFGTFEIHLSSRPSFEFMMEWSRKLCLCLQRPLRLKALPFVLYPKARVGIDLPRTRKQSALALRAQFSLRSTTLVEPICIYRENIQQKKFDQIQLESEIRTGLKKREFVSYFQPKINPKTNTIAGAEALVRWHRPGHGTLLPKEFISVAEQSELIHEIGEAVADQTIHFLARLTKRGKELPISINLSERDLDHASLISSLAVKLVARNIDTRMVSFEVSEKIVAIEDARHASFLRMIRKAGFELALDDFGTAYSSLARLIHLPIREIKLDRYFLHQANSSPRGLDLLVSTAQMLLKNKYRVTLEGIEKSHELRVFEALPGCLAQGFYFSPAVPASQLERML